MTNRRELIIGKKVGFNDNGKCLPLYTVEKFSKDGKKYYRSYVDGDGGGEWMPTDVLLKQLDNGKLLAEGLTVQEIRTLCKGRNKTANEKAFDRQLSYYENYGTRNQGKI